MRLLLIFILLLVNKIFKSNFVQDGDTYVLMQKNRSFFSHLMQVYVVEYVGDVSHVYV